ncbi:MAG: hypothetical protein WBV39_03020 [Rudaea sp.]
MQRLHRFLAALLYFGIAAYAIAVSIRAPFHNWDAIPYIASAKAFEQPDIPALQRFTYTELRRVLPAREYEDLAREKAVGPGRGGPYRHAVSTDTSVFAEVLPSYRIRPLFNGLVYVFYKCGVDIELATHLVPAIGVAAGLGFLYLLAVRFLAVALVYLLPLLALVFNVMILARFSTPDGLAFCAWMLCAWLYARGLRAALLFVLPIVLAIRTDLILFSLPLYVAMLVLDRPHWRGTALSLLGSVLIHFGIIGYWHHPGWKSMFACSVVTALRCLHPAAHPPTLTLADYLAALDRGLKILVADGNFRIYVALLAVAAWLLWMRKRANVGLGATATRAVVLIGASGFFMITRFLGLPAEWPRFFAAPYVVTAFCVAWLATDCWRLVSADRHERNPHPT